MLLKYQMISLHLGIEEGMCLSLTGTEETDCQGFKCAGSR